MKVSCLQENLAKGLAIAGRAVAARASMGLDILSNVMIATDQSRLKLSATNLEIGITCWIGTKVEDEGAITVPARLLTEFVNSLPNEKIDMELLVRTQSLHLRCGRFEANIKGKDAEKFPIIPTVSEAATTTIEPALLKEMITQVAFSAATDDTRPVLAGVLVSFTDSHLTMAAADGFRLSVRTVNLPSSISEKLEVIVPARTMLEVSRIIGEETEPVEITVTPNKSQILFRLPNVEVVSRLIEGQFPNYQQIIPTSYKTRVVVNTDDFLKATRIASFFARDSANIVRLQVHPGEELTPGRMLVAATAAEVGDNVGELDAIIDGEQAQIAFNARYLADVLGVIATPQVSLEMTGPSSPGVVHPVGGEGFTHVIMPMHMPK